MDEEAGALDSRSGADITARRERALLRWRTVNLGRSDAGDLAARQIHRDARRVAGLRLREQKKDFELGLVVEQRDQRMIELEGGEAARNSRRYLVP